MSKSLIVNDFPSDLANGTQFNIRLEVTDSFNSETYGQRIACKIVEHDEPSVVAPYQRCEEIAYDQWRHSRKNRRFRDRISS